MVLNLTDTQINVEVSRVLVYTKPKNFSGFCPSLPCQTIDFYYIMRDLNYIFTNSYYNATFENEELTFREPPHLVFTYDLNSNKFFILLNTIT